MSHQHKILIVVYTERGNKIRIISARTATKHEINNMKKIHKKTVIEDMQPEYDFSHGVRGKHFKIP